MAISESLRREYEELLRLKVHTIIADIKTENSQELEEVENRARALALDSLGLTELVAEALALREEMRAFREKVRARAHEIGMAQAKLVGLPEEKVTVCDPDKDGFAVRLTYSYNVPSALAQQESKYRDELLAGTDFGKKLSAAEALGDSIKERVLLAASPAQAGKMLEEFNKVLAGL